MYAYCKIKIIMSNHNIPLRSNQFGCQNISFGYSISNLKHNLIVLKVLKSYADHSLIFTFDITPFVHLFIYLFYDLLSYSYLVISHSFNTLQFFRFFFIYSILFPYTLEIKNSTDKNKLKRN